MPTLTSGNSVTLPMGAADSITIDTLQGATCVVEYPVGTRIAAFSGQRTLGPFTGSSALISVSGGDLYYEFADGSGPSLPVEYDVATGSFRAGGAPVSGGGNSSSAVPVAFTSRALTSDDNGKTLVTASAQIATVNTGLPSGFNVNAYGSITFSGTAAIVDQRNSGSANPFCVLVQIGTDSYAVRGEKP